MKKLFFILLFLTIGSSLILYFFIYNNSMSGMTGNIVSFIFCVSLVSTVACGIWVWQEKPYTTRDDWTQQIEEKIQQTFDVNDDSLLLKYRLDPDSAVGKEKLKIINNFKVFYFVLLGIILGVFKLYTNGYLIGLGQLILIIPGMQFLYPFTVWHGLLLGVLCALSSMYIRNIYTISGILIIATALILSSVIIGIMWPEIAFLGISQTCMILSLTFGVIILLLKPAWGLLNQYLIAKYVGKIFRLDESIRLENPPGLFIQPGHVGMVTLNGLKVVVVGDDLSFPIGSPIKIIGVDKKLRGLVIVKA